MDKVIETILSAPISTLLIVAGVGFLAITVLGKISNTLNAGKTGRIVSGAIGTALLIVGLSLSFKTTNVSLPPTRSPYPDVTANPLSPNPTIPLSSLSKSSKCLQQSLQDIPPDRIVTIESGKQDAQIIRPDQSKDQPIAIRLTDNGSLVGMIKFQFYSSSQIFKIQSVIDAQCRPVEDYRNTSRDGDKHVLQNWDEWKIRLGDSAYTTRLGYASDSIELSVNRSSPTP